MGCMLSVASPQREGRVCSFTQPCLLPGLGISIDAPANTVPFKAEQPPNILVVDDLPINQPLARKTIAKTGDHLIEQARMDAYIACAMTITPVHR